MRYLIPLIIFLGIAGFLWKGLKNDPHQLSSARIGKSVVEFSYPSLIHDNQPVTQKQFSGQISLLNIWATWCITCHAEHPILMDIARTKKIILYGLNYKDDRLAAKQWLEKYGNPYKDVVSDEQGKLAIDFGVYGTPETFVIDKQGIIRYKHIGPITPDVWKDEIAPVVEKFNNAN